MIAAACLWLLGLYAAGPVLDKQWSGVFADRLRNALILGVTIPLVLGLANLLYPVACWVLLAACVILAYRRHGNLLWATVRPDIPYVLVAALVLVAWPQLMRPLLEGDTLSYHLPNAASWVQSHGVWTTATRYWWYPPASELFASALYAVSGPYALGFCGFGALALIGFRVAAWARSEFSASRELAELLGAATVTALPLAMQAASLQNDVWVAAFWLETLWLIRRGASLAAISIGVCALVKPYGWVLALVAAGTQRANGRVWLAAGGAIGIWALRNALLWSHALVPPRSTAFGDNVFATSILAHGLGGSLELAWVALRTSPFVVAALGMAILAPLFVRGRAQSLAWCSLAAAILFVCLPFGYENGDAQLATGASLRFGTPAIALGALLLALAASRAPRFAIVAFALSTLFGAASVMAIFWNDLPTISAFGVAALAIGAVALARSGRVPSAPALLFVAGIVAAMILARRNVMDYYADALQVGDAKPGVYAWIARERPPAIGGWGVRLGVVNVISPQTRTVDLTDAAPCAQARSERVLLVTVAEKTHPAAENTRRLDVARGCGTVLFEDASAVVASPR